MQRRFTLASNTLDARCHRPIFFLFSSHFVLFSGASCAYETRPLEYLCFSSSVVSHGTDPDIFQTSSWSICSPLDSGSRAISGRTFTEMFFCNWETWRGTKREGQRKREREEEGKGEREKEICVTVVGRDFVYFTGERDLARFITAILDIIPFSAWIRSILWRSTWLLFSSSFTFFLHFGLAFFFLDLLETG